MCLFDVQRVFFGAGGALAFGVWVTVLDHHKGTKRPPLEYSDFTSTVLALRGLQLFAGKDKAKETAERVARARKWHAGYCAPVHHPQDTHPVHLRPDQKTVVQRQAQEEAESAGKLLEAATAKVTQPSTHLV